MNQIVECVPNFSEGRKSETVRALVATVQSVAGVAVLHETMDPDHHRSVLTFAGRPYAVAEAAFQVVKRAAELIDLRDHHGEHPRVGVTDVVPFVPIRDVTMDDCVQLAKLVGQRIGIELKIPVFLYEAAATNPDHINLEAIRRGGVQGLAVRMDAEAGWAPDFGPKQLHPTAGATVVGARVPLIAFNINLQTNDLAVAREIAGVVRQSNGGLPYVKAIGVALATRGLVQVSMNLTNSEKTSMSAAFEAVQREAQRRGVEIANSEVVGLVPQQALIRVAERVFSIEGLNAGQLLESRLEQAEAREAMGRATTSAQKPLAETLAEVSNAISAKAPAVTGAGAAALAGGLAATLGVMIARLNRARLPEKRLRVIRTRLHELVQIDRGAYAAVMQAEKIADGNADRPGTIAGTMLTATGVPLEIIRLCSEVVSLLRGLLDEARPDVRPDLRIGVQLARGIIDGCLDIVVENMKLQPNQQLMESFRSRIKAAEQKLVDLKSLCYTPPSKPWPEKILNKLKLR